MISKTEIQKMAGATIYSRGLDIYRSNRILQFQVEEGENGIDLVTAKVKGSGRNKYDVSFQIDTNAANGADAVQDAYCDCPAFFCYGGICKHCVAVLLAYEDDLKLQNTLKITEDRQKQSLAMLDSLRGMKPKTTPAMKQLLNQQTMKKILPMIESEVYGKVEIKPYLNCSAENTWVEFRIGISQMYLIKDIFTFADCLAKGSRYQYGQKLEFVHVQEAFTKETMPRLSFIQKWVSQNRQHYLQTTYNSYAGYTQITAKVRRLDLTAAELEEFLDTVGEDGILAEVAGKREQRYFPATEALPRTLRITGQKDGIELEINKTSGYSCNRFYIYFLQDKIYKVPKEEIEEISDFLSCMSEIPNRKAFIAKEDVATFCRNLLPDLQKAYECSFRNFDEQDYKVTPVSFKIYLDMPQHNLVTVRVKAVYGEREYDLYGKSEQEASRDYLRENEVAKIVAAYCNAYDEENHGMVISEEDKIYQLLLEGMEQLQEIGEVFISDALKKLKLVNAPRVTVGVSVTGSMMELQLTSADMPKEQLLEILSRYNSKKKYYRLKNGEFVHLESGEMAGILQIKNGLALTDSQLKQEKIAIPKYRALYLDMELKENPEINALKNKEFKALIREMKTVEDNDFEIPVHLESILREYQKRGFLWIKTLKNNGFGGILADDMGLGKTLQVICFLLSEYLEAKSDESKRCLIICPASLVYNWKNEMTRFAPMLPVQLVVGTAEERQKIIQKSTYRDILITSYELLRRDIEIYETMEFYCQVIDEAQYIKNHTTKAAKAVKSIQAGFRLALTGTPVENRLSELWSIFDYIMPGFLYGYKRFKVELEAPIVQEKAELELHRLQKMIRPFVLRRLKKEVLTDLPDKLEENVYAHLEGEQQQLYDAHVKRIQLMLDKTSDEEFKKSRIQILSELTKLRQICCDPFLLYENYKGGSTKLDMCMDMVISAVASGHKILLFSQFTSMLELLEVRLQEENISYYTLTGATAKEKRSRMVDDFNKDDTSVFCISLKAGGTGLNLTAADIVIHYDPWWNLAVQNQATDRAHRIGQKHVVNVYRLLVKDTIEENITKLQEQKKELADQVLNGEGLREGSFSKEELLQLLL
ncbi:MAG: SNF2 helicase associated domain-containing protein [Lachnospiraceae bacterium]|nr:SNF2 helicase associated domain-containing protein [Lachnospiraceae bacterium]